MNKHIPQGIDEWLVPFVGPSHFVGRHDRVILKQVASLHYD
jgi:hypothetical protein